MARGIPFDIIDGIELPLWGDVRFALWGSKGAEARCHRWNWNKKGRNK